MSLSTDSFPKCTVNESFRTQQSPGVVRRQARHEYIFHFNFRTLFSKVAIVSSSPPFWHAGFIVTTSVLTLLLQNVGFALVSPRFVWAEFTSSSLSKMNIFVTLALFTALHIPTEARPPRTTLSGTVRWPNNSIDAVPSSLASSSKFWCHGKGRGEIYFFDPTTPDTTIVVSTPWKIHYPSQVKEALRDMGFTMKDGIEKKNNCGWQKAGSVTYRGVKRGTFGFRTSGRTDEGPNDGTIRRLREVLTSKFPVLEVCLTCFLSIFGLLFIWVGLFGFHWLWMRCLWHSGSY